MKFSKQDKIYWGSAGGVMIVVLLLSIFRDATGIKGVLICIKLLIVLCFLAAALAGFRVLPWRAQLMKLMKELQNVRKPADPLFETLDTALRYDHYNSDIYLKMLATLNDFYQDTEKVILIAEDGDIERLYRRLDYLEKCQQLPESLNSLLSGFYLALLASSLVLWNEFDGWVKFVFWTGLTIFGIALFVIVRRSLRSTEGNFCYLVRRHEIELLKDRIREVENNVFL